MIDCITGVEDVLTKREYELINKAMFCFMEDEPLVDEDWKNYKGGFEKGMEILDNMRRAYTVRAKAQQGGKEKE